MQDSSSSMTPGTWAAAFNPDLDDQAVLGELFAGGGFSSVDVQPVKLTVAFDDPRLRITAPLGGTPAAEQIAAMSPDAYEAMVAEMLKMP